MTAPAPACFSHAMVLCAGFGTRMRPLSDSTPKPLIKVGGKHLADYAVDQAVRAGVDTIVANVHYRADQVEVWAKSHQQANIVISDERHEILETGGGVAKALPLLGSEPFLVFNSDAFWLDNPYTSAITALTESFDGNETDFALLLADRKHSHGYDGQGDFFLNADNSVTRRGEADGAPYVYAGCYAVHPRVFIDLPTGPFSMNVLWNRAIENNRIKAMVIDGLWLHVGTPQAVKLAEHEMVEFQKSTK